MACWSLLITLMCSVTVIQESNAYNVLFVGAIGSKSHQNFYKPIVEELAKSGHQVTLVTPFPSKGVKNNIREVVVTEGNVGLMNLNHFEASFVPGVGRFVHYLEACEKTLAHKEVQELSREKYDVILLSNFFCDCYLSLIHQLKVPFIYVSPLRLLSHNAEDIGNPAYPAFLNFPILDYQHPFTFLQRTANVILETFGTRMFRHMISNLEESCRSAGLCLEDMPSFEEIQKNVSMIFLNSVRELEFPSRPYVPGIVHAGGIHCRPAKPLPQDLQEWIEGSGEHGFIFFSLGSVVKSTDLPEKNRQMLIKVFSSLKQRVLWKWDDDVMPDLPPNVKIMKWLPQQDILGHSKLRLFMTHGGLFSTFESIYHGRPIIGLPVFADQQSNMKTVERQGWGKTILWKDMTEDILLQNIIAVMDNKQMQQHVQLQSRIMRDQPISPQETVVFWTEYVIRYNGAKHLRCPIADMPWYKVYNVDVWAMMLLLALLMLWIGVQLLRTIIKCFRRTPKNKTD
ncbi:UDP-glycosyltransferase UGT5-like [Macrobrachium rosenbergii]|uniref:UDP-glycosyltransferase UGT5-like n=1 Tax=Macrobrachium rosenbergii TaxID=79674 RepID=UPI0034D6C104